MNTTTANLFLFIVNAFLVLTNVVSIGILIYQIKKSKNVAKCTFLLELRDKFREEKRHEIHLAIDNKTQINGNDWNDVDDYLGLFEVCYIMIKNKVLLLEDFKNLYLYRIQNILKNEEVVCRTLLQYSENWTLFYKLLQKCFDIDTEIFDKMRKFSESMPKDDKLSSKQLEEAYQNLSEEFLALASALEKKSS
ncbi:MAG: hypothetical protein ACRCZB_00670 [Bacteroidales bacterium]